MVHTDYLWFSTKQRREFVRITEDVARIVKESGVKEGMVLVSAMHITASVFVNDWEDGLLHDFDVWLEKLAPAGQPYRHHQTGEDNADAHLKRTIMGHQVLLPITNGALDLGPWEQVFYGEFDGRRRKRVVVKVMGEVRLQGSGRVREPMRQDLMCGPRSRAVSRDAEDRARHPEHARAAMAVWARLRMAERAAPVAARCRADALDVGRGGIDTGWGWVVRVAEA